MINFDYDFFILILKFFFFYHNSLKSLFYHNLEHDQPTLLTLWEIKISQNK